jgi:hypothetical protein
MINIRILAILLDRTGKYMLAENLALLTKPLYFPDMKSHRIYYTEVELSQKSVTGRQKLSQCAKERHSLPPELKFQDGARVFQKIIGTRNTCYFAYNSFPLLKLLLTYLYNSSLKDVLV